MTVDSPLSPAAYKAAVRDKLENYRNLWEERYTGRMIGPVFYITHHSYWEWNRRTTGELNNALGFLKKTESGCRVYYIHTTGILNPFHLVLCFLLCFAVFTIGAYSNGMDGSKATTIHLGASLFLTAVTALFTAIGDAMTENGIEGANRLHTLMLDPTFGGTL